jgi:uncharacterized membrane protein YqaE (UPF0057 family)
MHYLTINYLHMKKILFFLFLTASVSSTIFTPLLAANISSSAIPVSTENATENPKLKITDFVKEFKSLSRKERKMRIKEVKKELRQYRKAKRNGDDPSTNTLLLVILAILLPPLAVYLHQGEINTKFWISLILTLLFFIPGIIYALIVVLGGDK